MEITQFIDKATVHQNAHQSWRTAASVEHKTHIFTGTITMETFNDHTSTQNGAICTRKMSDSGTFLSMPFKSALERDIVRPGLHYFRILKSIPPLPMKDYLLLVYSSVFTTIILLQVCLSSRTFLGTPLLWIVNYWNGLLRGHKDRKGREIKWAK